MPTLVREAGLSNKILTNHCIRSTCITILDQSGYEARHIMAISGHKHEESIKSYASKTSCATKRQISETLSKALAPDPSQPKIFCPPKGVNYLHTNTKCHEIDQGNKRPDDDTDKPNFDLGLCDLLELKPDDEANLLKELLNNEIPIPPNPTETAAKTANIVPQVPSVQGQTQNNTVNAWNPLQQMQQIMPKMVFQNSAITINFNVGK